MARGSARSPQHERPHAGPALDEPLALELAVALEDGVGVDRNLADHVRADFVLPMHHSTFRLSHEPLHEPMERLLSTARGSDRIIVREIGGAWVRSN